MFPLYGRPPNHSHQSDVRSSVPTRIRTLQGTHTKKSYYSLHTRIHLYGVLKYGPCKINRTTIIYFGNITTILYIYVKDVPVFTSL